MTWRFPLFLLLACSPTLAQQWLEVTPRELPVTVIASGLVTSADVMRFGPPPSQSWRTTITQLAREGQRVAEGDILARFDNSNADDRVRELDGQLAAASSELTSFLENLARDVEQEKLDIAEAESVAKKARQKADQPENLLASLDYEKLIEDRRISEKRLSNAKARLLLSARVREAQEKELEANIRRLRIQLQAAKDELDSFTLRAPRAGLVIIGTDRQGMKLDVNASINPGITVVELVDDNRLQVQAEVPEHASAPIAVNQSAKVVVDALGGAVLPGRVSRVANIVRRQSRNSLTMVRDVTVTIESQALPELRPGMSVKVIIEVDRLKNAIALPTAALIYRNGQPGVRTRSHNWQPIHLGDRSGDDFIILDGISAGTEVRF